MVGWEGVCEGCDGECCWCVKGVMVCSVRCCWYVKGYVRGEGEC